MKLTRGVRLATTVLVSQCNKILGGARQAGTRRQHGEKISIRVLCYKFIYVFFFVFFITGAQ